MQPPKTDHSSPYHGGPATSPGYFRVVVDSMLQGLGKQLRSCGVDVYILDNTDYHDKAIEVYGLFFFKFLGGGELWV